MTEKKNLAILFCSFRPEQLPVEVQNEREIEYFICLTHLLKVIPLDRFDVVVADNTCAGTPQNIVHSGLRDLLTQDMNIKDVYLFNGNLGRGGNKGAGELHMLKGVMDDIPPDTYKNVCYVTARRIFTCPYVFERTDDMKQESLMSNPEFLYMNGKYLPANNSGLFNDMFFSMTQSRMKEYADWTTERMEKILVESIGSEQNLYQFVTQNNVSFEFLRWLGIIRNDWMLDYKRANLENIHVC